MIVQLNGRSAPKATFMTFRTAPASKCPLIMKPIMNVTNLTLERRFFLDNSTTISQAYDSIVDIILFGLVGKQQRK
ncbi:hypothetical protein [Peribacillus asahii]|uniref:hypothetical protein n=1 Tax=Peribacillus asahii TaxID=228899 RepID=UPI0038285AD9